MPIAKRSRAIHISVLCLFGILLTIGFQNCGQFRATPTSTAASLTYNGLTIFDPDAGITYSEPIAPKGQFSSGYAHSCAVIAGDAVCWGANDYGQIGDGTKTSTGVPKKILVGGVTFVTTTNEINHRTCAIQDGALFCWGSNLGKVIDANPGDVPTPKRLIDSGVTAVSTSGKQICAVVNGSAKCKNGVEDFTTILEADVDAIAASQAGACAIVKGSAYCWGENATGQVGNGTTANVASPVRVLDNVQLLVKNGYQTCAIANYSLYCWGRDNYNIGSKPLLKPVELIHGGVSSLDLDIQGICYVKNSTVRCGRDLLELGRAEGKKINGLRDFDGDATSACAQTTEGFRCWGDNSYGQLGRGPIAPENVEAQYAAEADGMALGRFQTCYLSKGTLSCAGLRTAIEPFVLATNVSSMKFDPHYDGCFIQAGALKCFGSNSYGAIGTGAMRDVPIQSPATVFPSGVLDVDFDLRMGCAAKTDGVWCWGENYQNPLGVASEGMQKSPVKLLNAPAKIVKVEHTFSHGACAVMADSSLQCLASTGGLDNSANAKGFVRVLTSNVANVFLGTNDLCVIMTNGSLRCSRGSTFAELDPGPVKDVSIEPSNICYIKTNGEMKCSFAAQTPRVVAERVQGFAGTQQAVINNELIWYSGIGTSSLTSPTVLMTDVISASRGTDHTCALKTDGSMSCIGGNTYGQSNWRTRAAEQIPQPILPAQ